MPSSSSSINIPPVSTTATTYNERTYLLPPELATRVANLPPLWPVRHITAPVRFTYFLIYQLLNYYYSSLLLLPLLLALLLLALCLPFLPMLQLCLPPLLAFFLPLLLILHPHLLPLLTKTLLTKTLTLIPILKFILRIPFL